MPETMDEFLKDWLEADKPMTEEWLDRWLGANCPPFTATLCSECKLGEKDCTMLLKKLEENDSLRSTKNEEGT